MWNRIAATVAMLVAQACTTAEPVTYAAIPLGNGQYDMTFVSVALPDDAHETEIALRAAATCSGLYALHDVSVQDVVGLDDTENTPRRATKAILSCEAA
jgi:hypothetical protein